MASGDPQLTTTLVVVPTELELSKLTKQSGLCQSCTVQVCGFGPVESGVRTATLLALHRPQRALLVGIAGTYDQRCLDLGMATCFGRVAIDGIGAGSGLDFLSAAAIGFSQQSSLLLHVPQRAPQAEMLLTCCAASANAGEVEGRKSRFPQAGAEDMEGFAVARACQLANVPLAIVRGISNVAGNRQRATWQIDQALAAAAKLVRSILESDEPWEQAR